MKSDKEIRQTATNINLAAAVDAALQIAEERAKILAQMKEALLKGDDEASRKFARQLCGIEDHQK